MRSRRASAGEGWEWFVCGWRLFAKRPGLMISFTLVLLVLGLFSGVIPVLGTIIAALMTPLFLGAWYRMLKQLDNDTPVEIQDMFFMFGDAGKRGPLMALGVVIMLSQLLSVLLIMGLMGGSMAFGLDAAAGDISGLKLGIGGLLALLVVLLVATLVLLALFYAVPLIVFDDVPVMAAMKSSYSACMQNIVPLTVFGLVYFVAAIVAALPMGLGFLLLIPVSVAAAYCSYQSVFASVPSQLE